MSNYSRMDGMASRTPADVERRNNFGQSFAEVMGISKDAQTHATEAKEIAKRIEAEVLEVDVVDKINASAKTISLKSNRLEVNSDHFSLSADGTMKTNRGVIGKWDISDENGISKNTDGSYIKIQAPDTAESDFVTVALLDDENNVTKTPLQIKGNGDIVSLGKIESTNTSKKTSTIIDGGRISLDGEWRYLSNYSVEGQLVDARESLLMRFNGVGGDEMGLIVRGYFPPNSSSFVYKDIIVRKILEGEVWE